jgi:hypothetical protein
MPIAGAAADFSNERLFEIAPDMRQLLPEDLAERTRS